MTTTQSTSSQRADMVADAWLRLKVDVAGLTADGVAVPCSEDPEAFTGDDATLRNMAAATCRACPLERACDVYAEAAREPHGVWGGLDRSRDRWATCPSCGTRAAVTRRRGGGRRRCGSCGEPLALAPKAPDQAPSGRVDDRQFTNNDHEDDGARSATQGARGQTLPADLRPAPTAAAGGQPCQ